MRVIFIDYSVFMYSAIFAAQRSGNSQIPPTYTTMSMILGNLRLLNVTPDDKIIIAIDSNKGSWRKEKDKQYKANRKELREKHDIDWNKMFTDYRNLMKNIDISMPFFLVEAEKLEADDIISYGVRRYKDHECIIISTDSDYEQLTCFPNVKVWSPRKKAFKVVKNPYALLARKIEQERTDNLLTPVLNEADYNLRKELVDLMTLPAEIDAKAKEQYDKLPEKKAHDYEKLRFKSLHKRYLEIYHKPVVVVPKTEQMTLL